jgi:hypothetical protein
VSRKASNRKAVGSQPTRYYTRGKLDQSSRMHARTDIPAAGPVKVTKADGTVEVKPALTYAQRRDRTAHSSRQKLRPADKQRILERDNHTCRNCGTTKGPFHVDHIRPYSKGGWHVDSNLQTLCAPCNARKGATWERSR